VRLGYGEQEITQNLSGEIPSKVGIWWNKKEMELYLNVSHVQDSFIYIYIYIYIYSLHHRVPNGSGAHPASYPMGTGGALWG
jgi:hypothetical protein